MDLMKKKRERIVAKKVIKMKDIGREGFHFFECEEFTYLQQHNSDEKYFIFERLRRTKIVGTKANPLLIESDVEYRISYYIVGKIGTKKGKWTFGQYCPTIPVEDFPRLLEKAKSDKVIL